ncbi:MAG TPA: tetratricopeptide repeat-containing protein [Microscillaceae bacterium]|nr:tetratricopeptide repeat-containing protein [Microscillaceae bacterium]
MKTLIPKLLLYLIVTVLVSSCSRKIFRSDKITEQQHLTVTPTPLEVHGDQVRFTFSAEMPRKMMKKGVKYTLDVAYVTEDQENGQTLENRTPIGKIEFDGSLYENSKQAPVITKKMAFQYKNQHKKGYLVVYGTLSKGEEVKRFAPRRIQNMGYPVKGIATTSRLIRHPLDGVSNASGQSPFAYAHTFWKPDNPVVKEYNVVFRQGSDQIIARQGYNAQTLHLMQDAFRNMAAQLADPTLIPQWQVKSSSAHSPEGRIAINQDLPARRLTALNHKIKRFLHLFNYGQRQIRFEQTLDHKILKSTWPEFKFWVQKSTLSQDQKNEVVAIVDGVGAFAEKEKKLQALAYYPQITEQIYPKMRYAKMHVTTPNVIRTRIYLENLLNKITKGESVAQELTEDEYLFMVATTPSYATRVLWLEQAVSTYGTWRLYNNLGAAYLDLALLTKENKYIDKALQVLKKALLQKESSEIYYNLGMVYLMKEEQQKALEYFDKAIKIGGGNNQPFIGLLEGIKGYQTIQMARARHDGYYQKTQQLLKNAAATVPNHFNKGLVYLLEGLDYPKAQQSFEVALQLNPKDALSYYALAVVAARTNHTTLVYKHLKKAVRLDNGLRGQAWQDAEFARFQQNLAFNEAVR